ncbi:hypothetical protein M1O52_03950, partial [Dehalococcoidia bacterium]|nr:hypothetical protein [Dehalococcoidia bacterium]
MREYVNSKITGYSLILDWMEDEISAFQTRNDHTPIINFLKNKLLELKQSLSRLKAIFSIGDDRLLRRA